jgi:hypothetical protein
MEIARELDAHKKDNAEFPVRCSLLPSPSSFSDNDQQRRSSSSLVFVCDDLTNARKNPTHQDLNPSSSSSTVRWIRLLLFCTSSLIKPWSTTCYRSMTRGRPTSARSFPFIRIPLRLAPIQTLLTLLPFFSCSSQKISISILCRPIRNERSHPH